MTFLVLQNTRHHLPGMEIYIILQKCIEAVVARNLKLRPYPYFGPCLLCTLYGLDDSGCITIPNEGPLVQAAGANSFLVTILSNELGKLEYVLRDSNEMPHDNVSEGIVPSVWSVYDDGGRD